MLARSDAFTHRSQQPVGDAVIVGMQTGAKFLLIDLVAH
jgi:hypothetical protein